MIGRAASVTLAIAVLALPFTAQAGSKKWSFTVDDRGKRSGVCPAEGPSGQDGSVVIR